MRILLYHFLFFFNDTATTEIYTLSLHDALPICFNELEQFNQRSLKSILEAAAARAHEPGSVEQKVGDFFRSAMDTADRKSTRLNSSHLVISYAVFCLKKKKKTQTGLSG